MKAGGYCNALNATLIYPNMDEENYAVRRLMPEYGVGNEVWTSLKLGKPSISGELIISEFYFLQFYLVKVNNNIVSEQVG